MASGGRPAPHRQLSFEVPPRRWVVERGFARIGRNRRLAEAYERRARTSECLMKVAMIRLMPARLRRG